LRRRLVAAIGGAALVAVLAGSVFVPTKVQGPSTEVAYLCPPGMHPVNLGGFVFCWW
jgi:hypothetical protein